jgi:hypothetical protein
MEKWFSNGPTRKKNTDNYVECANLADQILVAIDEFCPCVSRFSTGQFLFQPKLFIILRGSQFYTNLKKNQSRRSKNTRPFSLA